MASSLPSEQRASYSAIIDNILATADLDTISAKAIRKGLQAQVDYDLTPQKDAIKDLIMERFDRVQREREAVATNGTVEPAPTANGVASHGKPEHVAKTVEEDDGVILSPAHKRKASTEVEEEEEEEEDELSDVKDTPPPAKKVRKSAKAGVESDEQMAKRLQAEYSAAGARATRGGGATRKKHSAKREKKPKKKSAAKIHSDDDSGVDGSSSPKPQKEKKGGFHKLLNLSEPLQALVGATQLSHPETVKRIWSYVKERDLQDPSDKRQIRCDDALRAVFKVDKVHMFTMNKVLATQLYPVEE